MDGGSLRKSALLGSATRGRSGHMTGDRDFSAQPDWITAFSPSEGKPLRSRGSKELGIQGLGVGSPKFTDASNPET